MIDKGRENKKKEIKGEKDTFTGHEAKKPYVRKRKSLPDADEFLQGILEGNRVVLGKAITLIESSLPSHSKLAQEIIEKCLPWSGKSIRIGITGVPGVGKSSLIEALGLMLSGRGHKLAVLAIDPSSEKSKGSILGDKTRMEGLAVHPGAFIRPTPSSGTLGGVARKTREAIILCEAAGYDIIIIETVGVGQSETAVHSMVDFFLLLMLAGAGDELQGIKRGIMEIADALVITKADGSNVLKAKHAKTEYENALHLFPLPESGWLPQVLSCSSHQNEGIEEIWEMIENYRSMVYGNNYFQRKRKEQARYWMYETINTRLRDSFYSDPVIRELLVYYENKVGLGEITPFVPAKILMEQYLNKKGL